VRCAFYWRDGRGASDKKGRMPSPFPCPTPLKQKTPPGGGVFREAAGSVFQEAPKLLGAARMAELAQGLGFDLADALAGDVELLADFFQRVIRVHVDAEAHAQDLGLARREAGKDGVRGFAQAFRGGRLDRRDHVGVLDEVAKM